MNDSAWLHGRLAAALVDPRSACDLPEATWSALLPLGRAAGLLARLAVLLDEHDALARVPERPRQHLIGERILAEKHARDVRWEVRCISEALAPIGVPVLLLKGAAYLLAGLPAARGRMFADVDILVPRDRLADVEAALKAHGWNFDPELDPYDEAYYRRFMHQIPPMAHRGRGTSIDVHHTIVPETARLTVDAALLRATAVTVEENVQVPAPVDLVLHSAVHLFNEGSFDRALRDLDDITRLLRHFDTDPGFAPTLRQRASQLNLVRPLFYALRYAQRLLAAPIDEQLLAGLPGVPVSPQLRMMDALFLAVLESPYYRCRGARTAAAAFILYVRSHYLRMPPRLLLPHLARKAWRRMTEGPQKI
jgi:hypothetical protein